MKGPFALILIGGGIILLYGLFTGKITVPSTATGYVPPNPANTKITGTVPGSIDKNPPPAIIRIGNDGNCPTGYHKQRLGSVIVCVANK